MVYSQYAALALAALAVLALLVSIIRAFVIKKSLPVNDVFGSWSPEDMLCAEKLSEMVKFKTLGVTSGGDQAEFDRYRDKLDLLFPEFFSHVEELSIEGAYVWRIKGAGGGLPALILAHSDIVEAQGKWDDPPFAGIIKDGKIYGRGTLDNKGMLCAALTASEKLLCNGFAPKDDVYIVSTQNEETTSAGAINCREYFEKNGIRFGSILDEGGAITCDVMPGVANDMALAGLCEKGYIDMRFTAVSSGGHSSSPGKGTPIARLAAFVNHIETRRVFRIRILPTLRDMFKAVSPHMAFPYRLLLGNFRLYGLLLRLVLPGISPQIGAMMKTTIVFTRCEGGEANNVIPTSASVTANIRNLPGESCEEVIEKLEGIAKRYGITAEVVSRKPASSVTRADSEVVRRVFSIVEKIHPGAIAVPYLTIGATDCCRLNGLSDNIIRFSPLRASGEEVDAMHGDNERIGIAELGRAADFFLEYIAGL